MIILITQAQKANPIPGPDVIGTCHGVGLGGNGTQLGSTASVFIVTISERLAREEKDPSVPSRQARGSGRVREAYESVSAERAALTTASAVTPNSSYSRCQGADAPK